MPDNQEREFSFEKGGFAKKLRMLLYKDLTDQDVEGIVVTLLSHLLIEERINELLYHWLRHDIPEKGPDSLEKVVIENNKMKDGLWTAITKLQFAQKFTILEPIFLNWWPTESKDIWKINDLRNDIFHGKKVKDVQFKGKSIGTDDGAEEVYMTAQFAVQRLATLSEQIEGPHALANRWAERLKELGEPLMLSKLAG